nr:CRISPR-associated endonuclease Cas2 [uncultured Rhodopila sp.]
MPQIPRLYLALYDVAEPRRWRKVHAALKAAGAWAQLSAFFCRMTPPERDRLVRKLISLLDPAKDRLLVIDLGPADSAAARIQTIGGLLLPEEPSVLIL